SWQKPHEYTMRKIKTSEMLKDEGFFNEQENFRKVKKSYLGYKRYSPDKEEKALIIPSNVIDMTDVIHEEIYAIPYKKGRPQKAVLMKRGGKYTFDADYVVEIPRQYMQAAGMVDYDPYLADFISSP